MTNTLQPRTDFDIPRVHLSGERPYIPPRTRNPELAAIRHERPAGMVVLEAQLMGSFMLPMVLERVSDAESVQFASQHLSAAAMNSSWYLHGQSAPGMRRRQHLARTADDMSGWRETPSGLRARIADASGEVVPATEVILAEHLSRRPVQSHINRLGRMIGDLGLMTASLPIVGVSESTSAFVAQEEALDASTRALELSRTLSFRTGTDPSLAALSDPDSGLSVHWRRTAPDQAHQALLEVQALFNATT